MGISMIHQAIPGDGRLILLAKSDAQFGCELQFFSHLIMEKFYRPDRNLEEFEIKAQKEAEKAAITNPGIESRNLFLSKHMIYESLFYVLSGEIYFGEEIDSTASELAKAVFGAEIIHPAVRATQGFPIRYTPSEKVKTISELLVSISDEEIEARLQLGENPSEDKAWIHNVMVSYFENFDAIRKLVSEFRGFYTSLAKLKEAVLVILD
ncbi:MAG: hypothetical protein DPW16_16250 [Chloroflexi bacterium]|nr:hypothetical protein [Chloroflexota bacterium]